MTQEEQRMWADPGWQYLRLSREEMMKIQSRPYDSKKNVWAPDPEEGYIAGEITGVKQDPKHGEMVTVITAKGSELTLKREQAQEMNPPKFDKTEDMANLTFLNDASVLGNLRSRYGSLLIYTYSGLFCVVINPYKRLPIYTDSVARFYIGKRKNEMPPHLYAASDEAYRNMLQDHQNQSMLITGESGAGKTENTKKVIGYFASVGASQKEADLAKSGKEATEKIVTLEDQIVQTNPVLEAFGNAKTVRNNNSSRFGKFIRIMFNKAGKVASCDIDHYLLEKSRCIRQAPGERCFHIFYQIFSGNKPELIKELQLDKPLKDYWYIAQAELKIDGMDDKEEHGLTEEAFDILMFTPEEKKNCYQILSAMQHIGISKFKQSPRGEQAETDGMDEPTKTAAMFGVDVELYLKALCQPRVRVGNEWVNKGQNVEQVSWACGAVVKAMYARMFKWIVEKCNETLDQKGLSRDYFIGVLDIAGFEIFDFNSFEQLWINFVNEKLQQFFNHHMFVLEQEEYKREGIQWTFIDFGLDLQACIELIEKPLGIISMLDEECIVPKATDMTLAEKLSTQHLGKHPNFVKPPPPKGKQAEAHFAMKHYAGLVRYNVMNWLEKNKDPLNDTLVAVLKASKENKLLNTIWESYTTQEEAAAAAKEGGRGKGGKSGSFMTVSMMYRESLNRLMTMLHATHPHFIRCIIPNEKKQCGLIEAALVLNQLTCNGVLEGIRICRKGFPNRTLHEDFKQRYAILASAEAKSTTDEKKAAEAMLQSLLNKGDMKEEMFRVGHTKVFFKAGVLAHLEDLRDEKLGETMKTFQARCRWFLQQAEKRRLMLQKRGLLILHRNIRTWTVVRTWDWFLLFGKLRPQLKVGKEQEEIDKMNERIKQLEETLKTEEAQRKALEDATSKLVEEKNAVFKELEDVRSLFTDLDSKISALSAQKRDLEKQVNELSDRLGEQEDRNADINRGKKKVEGDCDNLRKKIEDLEGNLRKTESEKDAKDHQIRSLQDEMSQLDETIAKLNKEKKQQEEINRKLQEDVTAEEDKSGATNKLKQKIEKALDDLEDQLEREKRARNDLEKQKRKVEGELRIAEEALEEGIKQRADVENNLKKKEAELQALGGRLEEEQSLVGKLQRQLKELQAKIGELEEELEAEHQGRTKADRLKADLQRELDELSERLDEQGGQTAAQIEVNKKREAELAKIRRELEEQNMNHENQLGALRKKHTDSVAELSEQIDQVQKAKAKSEKDRAQVQREYDDLQSQLDSETSGKLNNEKLVKQFELQVAELQTKVDEQTRQLQELTSLKSRMTSENSDMNRQLEEIESQINNLGRVKNQLTSQLEEARRTADEEARDKNQAAAQAKNYQHEAEQLKEQIEEEIEGKNEALRNLSKANAEIQQWKTRIEGEDLALSDEIDDAKRRQQQKLNELQEALDAATSKVASLEKTRSRLQSDLDDAQVDVERANGFAKQLEQKQKGFDKIAGEWKKKTDDLLLDIDSAQRDNRNLSTDLFKMKNTHDELLETIEGLRRENKALTQEIRDLMDQLGEGGRSVQELQQAIRHVELEKEELQRALDEAEAALEAEESKVLRAQVEVSQIRAEIEKRIQEKEEEFENTRRNHQRALDSMQASLENETKGKAELLRIKKKLESDINELEVALDHANRANADAQKNIRLYGDQIRELQQQIEIEQRARDEIREQYLNQEKRATLLQSEKEEITVALEQAERARKAAEREALECHDKVNELGGQAGSLAGAKKKLEAELQAIQADLDETLNEYHASEERSKKAAADAARLAEELRIEQENANQVERIRKALELQLKDMQTRLDEAEAAALKGGKKVIEKLEKRIHDLELELDGEQRRNQDVNKNIAKQDRRVRELQFQIDEDKKNFERMQDLVDKLQNKLKGQKKQIEEAEEVANLNLQKYRQLQHQLEDAEERADLAENSLSKMRAKSRSAASVAPGGGLQTSQSAAVMRAPSRSRFD